MAIRVPTALALLSRGSLVLVLTSRMYAASARSAGHDHVTLAKANRLVGDGDAGQVDRLGHHGGDGQPAAGVATRTEIWSPTESCSALSMTTS